jgi:hypothetical protein
MVSFNLSKRKAGVVACLEKEREKCSRWVGGAVRLVCFIGNACEELCRTPSHCCVSLSLCRVQTAERTFCLNVEPQSKQRAWAWPMRERKDKMINHQPSPWTNSSFTNELTA